MTFHEIYILLWHLTSAIQAQKSKPKNRFPLLKLPRVVLLECIENLDVFEIILFSLLSKRTKSFAKLIRWNLLDIHMTSEGDPQIWFKLPNAPGLDWVIDYNKQEEASVYPVFQSSLKGPSAVHYLVLHNNGNCIDDMKKMVEHICEVFRSPISDIREESLIEWIIKFQPIIRRVWICKDVISSVKTLDRMFKSLKVTEVFGLGPILTDEAFQVTEPIPSRCISFWKSYWLTLPSILNGSNSHIFLYDLTAKDINTLLMEWQMGAKLQNLEFLKIEYVALQDRDSFTEILEDLDFTDDVGYDERPATVKIDDDWTITPEVVQTCYNLIRSDGMIGSIIELKRQYLGEKRKICFNFQVWRKSA